MGYGGVGFSGGAATHVQRYLLAVKAGNTAGAATLEQQAYAHTQQNIPDRATWQRIYNQIEAAKAALLTKALPPSVIVTVRPPVVTPIIPPPPSQLPGGSGGPVVVVPGTPGRTTADGSPPVLVPSTDGASGGAVGGGGGAMAPAMAAVSDGLANLAASVKANPIVAVAAVLAVFYALRKGRGTRRW